MKAVKLTVWIAVLLLLTHTTPLCLGQDDYEVRASLAGAHWYTGGDGSQTIDVIVRPIKGDSVDLLIVTRQRSGTTEVLSERLPLSFEVEPWDFDQPATLPAYSVTLVRKVDGIMWYCKVKLSVPLRHASRYRADVPEPVIGCFARIKYSRTGAQPIQSPVLYSRSCRE